MSACEVKMSWLNVDSDVAVIIALRTLGNDDADTHALFISHKS